MSTIKKISKPIILKYENREICLPEALKNDIDIFWNKALEEKL